MASTDVLEKQEELVLEIPSSAITYGCRVFMCVVFQNTDDRCVGDSVGKGLKARMKHLQRSEEVTARGSRLHRVTEEETKTGSEMGTRVSFTA